MRYTWATGHSLPGYVGMGVNFPLDLAAAAFGCLMSPSLPAWQGWSGHGLKTWRTGRWTVYHSRRQLSETFEEEQAVLQISVSTALKAVLLKEEHFQNQLSHFRLQNC